MATCLFFQKSTKLLNGRMGEGGSGMGKNSKKTALEYKPYIMTESYQINGVINVQNAGYIGVRTVMTLLMMLHQKEF